MAFCGRCGTKLEEGVKFCPSCGANTGEQVVPQQQVVQAEEPQVQQVQPQQVTTQPVVEPQEQATQNITNKLAELNNTIDSTADYDKADIEANKVMAIFAYFGPLVLIPLFAAKESKYARFHANQGLVLCIAAIAYAIVSGILSAIILAISWRLYFLTTIISLVGWVFTVLAVIGIVNVVNGKAKELPLIGNIKLLK